MGRTFLQLQQTRDLCLKYVKNSYNLIRTVQTNFKNGHFTKECATSVNKHMINFTSVSREMQMGTIIRYHCTAIRETKI